MARAREGRKNEGSRPVITHGGVIKRCRVVVVVILLGNGRNLAPRVRDNYEQGEDKVGDTGDVRAHQDDRVGLVAGARS